MSERTLTFRVRLRDDGTVAGIDKLDDKLKKLGDTTDDLDRKNKGLSGTFSDLAGKLGGVRAAALAFIGAASTGGVLLKQGIEYNAQLETSRIGLAALVNQFAEIRDAQGRLLEGSEKFSASQRIAVEMQEQLRIESLKTTAEFEDLLRVVQSGLGPALQAGFDTKQVVEFTRMVAQAGAALDITADQLPQEIRSLLAGEKGPDSRLANALLGDVVDAKKMIRELADEGKLFDFFEEKMKSFSDAGESLSNTFAGALSNLKDAVTEALGEATQGTTNDLTTRIKELTAEIVTFDEQGRATFNEDFVEGVRLMGDAFIVVADAIVEGVKNLGMYVDYVGALKEQLSDWRQYVPWGDTESLDELIAKRRGAREQRALARSQRRDSNLRMQEEVELYGAVVSDDLIPSQRTVTGKPRRADSNTQEKARTERERLQELKDDYLRWHADFSRAAEAQGDPLKEALARIEKERAAALDKLDDYQKKLKNVLGSKVFEETRREINAEFDDRIAEASMPDAVDWKERILTQQETIAGYARELQDAIERERIEAIEDGIERELQVRLKASSDWYASEVERLDADLKAKRITAGQHAEILQWLADRKKKLDEKAAREADKARAQELAKTARWAKAMADVIQRQLQASGALIVNFESQAFASLQSGFDSFFSDLAAGQVDIGDTFMSVAEDIGQAYSQMFSGMMQEAIFTEKTFSEVFRSINQEMKDSGALGSGMYGLGIGSMVGGVGQAITGPDTYAATGGMIGGLVGAIIGYFAGSPQVGAYIGAAIGTAIGGMITKGKDSIYVAVVNGVVRASEKGLSKEGLARITRDVQKKVKDTAKDWTRLIDLFPETMQEELDRLVKPINTSYSLTDGDIKDSTAFNAISDFFAERLPQAALRSYEDAITRGLQLLGVSEERIKQQFEHWGELQGKEIQDAVRAYIETLLEAQDLQKLFSGDLLGDARELAGRNVFSEIDEFTEGLGKMVDELGKLDAEDQITKQREINKLAREHYEFVLRKLQEIDAMEKASMSSIESFREQIQLAGKDDQGKIDYYYERMWALRQQLSMSTDPEEIQRILAELQSYGQAAFSLAPENEENRQKLLDILDDIETEGRERYQAAREAILEKEEIVADLLKNAATSLAEVAAEFKAWLTKDEGGPVDETQTVKDAWRQEWLDLIKNGEDLNEWLEMIKRDFGSLHEFLMELFYPGHDRGPQRDPNWNPGYYPDPYYPKHATGLLRVPYDGYIASLHKGERVLTAAESARLDKQDLDAYRQGRSRLDISVNVTGNALTPDQARDMMRQMQQGLIRHIRSNPDILASRYD